ncbi:MAG TPA: hypothetical protein PKL84_03495 [Candidatus Hydrogenedentes bacterium]|nr:hypothetical protein [Candidatus Hydrogenedentota bacterium]
MAADRVVIGTVRSVAPGRREVRIRPAPGYERAFDTAWLRIAPPGAPELRCRVETMRRHGEEVIAVLTAGVPRESIARMRGAAVVAAPGERPEASEGDVPVAALIGLHVIGPDGAAFGEVVEVYETSANAAFAVRRTDGTRLLLPAIQEVVTEIDLEKETLRLGDIGPYAVEA